MPTPIRDANMAAMHDALTRYDCRSLDDVASLLGWTRGRVAVHLNLIRQPAIADLYGWTVPHIGNRPDKLLQVVEFDGAYLLDEEGRLALRDGAVSTLHTTMSQSTNQSHTLGFAIKLLDDAKHTRPVKRVITASEAIVAMAEDAIEQMEKIT